MSADPVLLSSRKRPLRALAVILSLSHALQCGSAHADLIAAQPVSEPSAISIDARMSVSEWETLDQGVSLAGWAEGAITQIPETLESLWDRATSWAREQMTSLEASAESDDTYFNSRTFSSTYDDLWWLKEINAPEAWGLSTGAGVTIAVVDTGVDYVHRDLSGNIHTNSGEIAGNGIDDDNNGLVDDWRGWDFVNSDNDATDDQGHGTHVAGIIGALKDNGTGIAGVAPNAKILGVKVLDKYGSGSFDNIIKGIRYAADQGARIINLSLGAVYDFTIDYIRTYYASYYNAYLKPIQDAILYAAGKGSIVIAASGNSGVDVNRAVPAGFTETLSVGATTPTGSRAYFSNYGTTLDLTAPGWDVLSLRATGTAFGTAVGSGYARASGTSMATPVVSGVVALLLAQDPTLNLAGIERRLKFSATDLGTAGFDASFGYGQVDALKAITHDYHSDGTVKTRWLLAADEAGMVRYDYDLSGRVVASVAEDGTRYQYDGNGDRVEFFANGRLSARTDALTGTRYEFLNENLDGKGLQRVARRIETDGTVITYAYWGTSSVLKQSKTEKDGALKIVRLMDATGRVRVQTEYDGAGKVERTFHLSGNVRQVSVWDGESRVSVTRFSDVGTVEYEALYVSGVVDREIFNDAQGRLIREKRHVRSSPEALEAEVVQKSYTYWDSSERIRSSRTDRDGVLESAEQYDADGNLVLRVIVEGARKTETFYYAAGGVRQVLIWEGGVRSSLVRYSDAGVLRYRAVYSGGQTVSEDYYDAQGRLFHEKRLQSDLLGIVGPSLISKNYGYWDQTDQVKAVTVRINGAVQSTEKYDAGGILLSKTLFEGTVRTQTNYWSDGKPSEVFVWDGASRVSETRYYESGVMSYLMLFDSGEPETLTTYLLDGSVLESLAY